MPGSGAPPRQLLMVCGDPRVPSVTFERVSCLGPLLPFAASMGWPRRKWGLGEGPSQLVGDTGQCPHWSCCAQRSAGSPPPRTGFLCRNPLYYRYKKITPIFSREGFQLCSGMLDRAPK